MHRPSRLRRHPLAVAALLATALAALSLAVGPVVAGYDPLAWLAWGRELAAGGLDTREGPAFKPLPVLAIAPVAGLLGDDAALHWWLLLARAAALLAVGFAAILAWRSVRGDGPRTAGADAIAAGAALLAAGGVLLTGDWLRHGLPGAAEPLVVLAALGALLERRAGRDGRAWAWTLVAVLLRPESWPFAGAFGLWLLLRRRPPARGRLRLAVLATAPLLPLLWIVPEWWGSGDPGRSSARARIPNPGQPALDAHPFARSLDEALSLAVWPLLVVLAVAAVVALLARRRWSAADRELLALAGGGAAWVLLVAAMSEAGYSGEARYQLPGVALLTVAGAIAAGRLARAARGRSAGEARASRRPGPALAAPVAAVLLVATAAVAVERGGDLAADWRRTRVDARTQQALWRAVARAGGRDAILRCGRPVIGRFRAPQLAWPLDVAKAVVDEHPLPAPSVVFSGPLVPGAPATPAAPAGHREIARAGPWRVLARCREDAVRSR
ncbi:hypothetical protein [Patulibacter defluvii]|uniref:hypothetical protein n=1 Tax=Patulibacter defluvii TaxID=3095358 RepID=UPI002A74753B|nr:hypothetical protein [Patulibacter sp. DM4]